MTLSEFFFDIPIYEKILINAENNEIFRKILDCTKKEEFEGYNPWQKIDSTFIVITDLIPNGDYFIKDGGYGIVNIKCKRTDNIFTYYIYFRADTSILMKIGQYPTIADFHISEIKQYSKLLSNEKLKEFTRAIGLAANGVGIGSFVYLRRIFENLIFEASVKAIEEGTINEGDFQKSRMDNKIELLKSYLPNFLVENKLMYSILSLGIHELDEQTCLANFDTLRVGIEIILDEKLDELRKKEKIDQAKQKLAALKAQIKK
ncbi:hypothetical protein [Flavobacterium sp. CAN_S2]|uniref:hypothetical protein n=1 Tax=Flavobacterium sp. CAN_S2 TaxID=2787726 RepID=UPI0018CB91E5